MGWTARSLALGQGFSSPFYPQTGPTALVCPLYPFLLAGIFKVFGLYTNTAAFVALSLNSLFSAATAGVIYFGMWRQFGSRTARAAAWFWAVYPYAVYYSAVYLWDCALTSLLCSCCFFLALARLPRMRLPGWAGYGVLAGLAALSNPSILPLIVCLMLYAAWQRMRRGEACLPRFLAAFAMLLLMLAPWAIRNRRVMHQTVLTRDGFWGEFYAGNAGDTSRSNPSWTHPASNSFEMKQYQRLGELGYMDWKRTLSMERIHHHAAGFLLTSLHRVVRFWTGYWSFSRDYLADEPLDLPNVPLCVILTGTMAVGVWQLYRRKRDTAIPYLAAFLIFPLPYYITHASMDYRQPVEPMIVSATAYGAVCLIRSRREALAATRIRHTAEAEQLQPAA